MSNELRNSGREMMGWLTSLDRLRQRAAGLPFGARVQGEGRARRCRRDAQR